MQMQIHGILFPDFIAFMNMETISNIFPSSSSTQDKSKSQCRKYFLPHFVLVSAEDLVKTRFSEGHDPNNAQD